MHHDVARRNTVDHSSTQIVAPVCTQGNEVYGGGRSSAGIFLHRSSDDAVVKGEQCREQVATS